MDPGSSASTAMASDMRKAKWLSPERPVTRVVIPGGAPI
jgi:hypothetical protein